MIAFAAGANTLFELARFDPSVSMGAQGFVHLPHLAAIGIGFDEAGSWTGAGVLTIAIVHLILSMVYGAGGLMHAIYSPEDLQKSDQTLRDQKLDGRAHLLTRGGLTCSGLPPRSRSGAERALSAQALRADAAVERWLLRRSARGGAMRGSEAFCST